MKSISGAAFGQEPHENKAIDKWIKSQRQADADLQAVIALCHAKDQELGRSGHGFPQCITVAIPAPATQAPIHPAPQPATPAPVTPQS